MGTRNFAVPARNFRSSVLAKIRCRYLRRYREKYFPKKQNVVPAAFIYRGNSFLKKIRQKRVPEALFLCFRVVS